MPVPPKVPPKVPPVVALALLACAVGLVRGVCQGGGRSLQRISLEVVGGGLEAGQGAIVLGAYVGLSRGRGVATWSPQWASKHAIKPKWSLMNTAVLVVSSLSRSRSAVLPSLLLSAPLSAAARCSFLLTAAAAAGAL